MNPWIILGVAGFYLASVGGAAYKGYRYGYDVQEAEAARVERIARAARDAAQQGAAVEIAKLTVTHTTIKQKVEKEIYEKPVYRECVHSPDGLRWVNAALAGGSLPAGGGKLSRELGDSGKRDVRGNDE